MYDITAPHTALATQQTAATITVAQGTTRTLFIIVTDDSTGSPESGPFTLTLNAV
jgi:hypothetical protein